MFIKEQGWNRGKDSLKIRAGRLDEEEMEALIRRENASLVIDATHPYADQATANIRKPAVMFRM